VASSAVVVHRDDDLASPLASGSFKTAGMVISPCSIKTLSAVANCYSSTLIARAADVTPKERRPLILVVRETPLHLGHLRLMVRVAEMGAVVLPPMPAFYHGPKTIADLVDHTVGKIMDLLRIQHELWVSWGTG
jgi:4-hydroxy-3-polyprenylbenzoate decarboxylase